MIPFSLDIYLGTLEAYAAGLWPGQLAAGGLGLAAVLAIFLGWPAAGRLNAAVLAAAWAWVGGVYYGAYFTDLNWAAWAAAGVFVAQAAVLAWLAHRDRFDPRFTASMRGYAGLGLMIYALAAGPLAGLSGTAPWPAVSLFGVHPGPTVLFSLGALSLCRPSPPVALLVVPMITAGASAAAGVLLGIHDDLAGVPAGLGVLILALSARKRA
ncbi:MAG: DUF6064 family protein [Magnetovibrio sp.]|nr:DUF6064 family protein [Magnetovibrio sp.]